MPHQILLSMSNAVAGRELEYSDWYDNVHLPQIVRVPGVISAQRYVYDNATLDADDPSPRQYLAIYEIDGDPQTVVRAILDGMQSGLITGSDAITHASTWAFRTITPVMFES